MSGFAQVIRCDALSMLGKHGEATRSIRTVLAAAEQSREQLVVLWSTSYLACALLSQPDPSEAVLAEAGLWLMGFYAEPACLA